MPVISVRSPATTAGLVLTLAMAFGNLGCGGGEPGVIPVSGRVTYNGQPLTSGDVYFSPDGGASARGAQGKLDSNGNYVLGTFDARDGAYTGSYKVSIVARGPDKPIPAKKVGKMMEEDMQGTGDPLIPKKYFNAETSGLKADVAVGKTNKFHFDLSD